MTPVKFEGEPPFTLPTVQRGRVSAVDDTVEMTVFVLAPGQGNEPVPVRAQMIVDVAEFALSPTHVGTNPSSGQGAPSLGSSRMHDRPHLGNREPS